jgi:hypothetical protein
MGLLYITLPSSAMQNLSTITQQITEKINNKEYKYEKYHRERLPTVQKLE